MNYYETMAQYNQWMNQKLGEICTMILTNCDKNKNLLTKKFSRGQKPSPLNRKVSLLRDERLVIVY
jgi:hypothetical protein